MILKTSGGSARAILRVLKSIAKSKAGKQVLQRGSGAALGYGLGSVQSGIINKERARVGKEPLMPETVAQMKLYPTLLGLAAPNVRKYISKGKTPTRKFVRMAGAAGGALTPGYWSKLGDPGKRLAERGSEYMYGVSGSPQQFVRDAQDAVNEIVDAATSNDTTKTEQLLTPLINKTTPVIERGVQTAVDRLTNKETVKGLAKALKPAINEVIEKKFKPLVGPLVTAGKQTAGTLGASLLGGLGVYGLANMLLPPTTVAAINGNLSMNEARHLLKKEKDSERARRMKILLLSLLGSGVTGAAYYHAPTLLAKLRGAFNKK